MSAAAVVIDPWEAVRAVNGPVVAVPFRLLQIIKDARAAVMLYQGVYLSSLCKDRDGWFSLHQVGDADLDSKSIFSRMGSWAALGCGGPDGQRTIRRKLEGMGVLQTKFRGQPGRLFYRFSPEVYLQIMTSSGEGNSVSGNPVSSLGAPASEFPDALNLVSGNPVSKFALYGGQFGDNRNLAAGSPLTSDIDTQTDTHIDQEIDQDTHRSDPDDSVSIGLDPAQVEIKARLELVADKKAWPPRLREALLFHLLSLRLIEGGKLTHQCWDQVFAQLSGASNPLRWLIKVVRTGWDPRPLSSLAKRGETVDEVILRVSRERDQAT